VNALAHRWQSAYREIRQERSATRRALYDRAEIFARWRSRCAYCDAPAEHLDHVVPISRGGADAAHNLLPACAPCNLSKSDKSLADWAMTFGAPSANGVSA
jgi:5-methylcytosine-specific restriction endonuclease McrA